MSSGLCPVCENTEWLLAWDVHPLHIPNRVGFSTMSALEHHVRRCPRSTPLMRRAFSRHAK